jgi:hypothetical protein
LSSSRGILCGTTSNQLGVVILQKILVQIHVLCFSQNRIVGFETIFLEQFIVSTSIS